MNYVVLIGAILIIIIGWLISNTERFTFMYYIFASRYLDAKAGLAKLQEKDAILTKEDTGFSEIAELLKEDLTGNGVPIITQIKTVEYGIRTVDIPHSGMEEREYLELELSFSNGKPVTGTFDQLESRTRQKYLSGNITIVGDVIIWVGIALVLFDGLFEKKD